MNRQKLVWQLILDSLEGAVPVMLLYVVESKGSSPGRQGFFMAVNEQDRIEGSVGGGIMEHKFIEMSKERLAQLAEGPVLRRQVHDKEAAKDRSGMICSGEQTILLYPVRPADVLTVWDILECLGRDGNGLLRLSPEGMAFSGEPPEKDFRWEKRSEKDWLYEEKIGYKHHLYIVGGGHCALALSRIMQPMDFALHLFEHRGELHTLARNEFVQEKIVLKEYDELSKLIPGGNNHYVIVMTLGYRTDDKAVRALLGKRFRYFGVLGSRAKMERLFSTYRSEGIAEAFLQPIHSPAGLPIKSQTPDEIAVSIAAEIIQEKNREYP
ncbi:MAG TPA: XdhC family protein [Puia sp.]|nr:XdhC family protein [Puia sp.]